MGQSPTCVYTYRLSVTSECDEALNFASGGQPF